VGKFLWNAQRKLRDQRIKNTILGVLFMIKLKLNRLKTSLLVRIIIFSTIVSAFTFSLNSNAEGKCIQRKLTFSADRLLPIPSSPSYVWGGNATEGGEYIDPPYSSNFLSNAGTAKEMGLETFAYLEGPCGNTGGKDDGEVSRCEILHRSFNARFSPETEDSAQERWKPYTLRQMELSEELGIDYCEIDNLENNVKIPLIPILQEIKNLYESGKIHCRLVLKNINEETLTEIKNEVAPSHKEADFIAPFHIFEADDLDKKSELDDAMKKLKGNGAVTIFSTNTNAYGSEFTDDSFLTCGSRR
jgi:hypothetical protein